MADKSVRINIDGKNNLKPAVDAAKDDLAGLKKELKAGRMEDRALRFNLGTVIGDQMQKLLGKFGAWGAAATAAFGGGWAAGKWLRDLEIGGWSLGKALDNLLVPAKEVHRSIRDMADIQLGGLKGGIDASKKSMQELAKASALVVASLEVTKRAERELNALNTQQKVSAERGTEGTDEEVQMRQKVLQAQGSVTSLQKEEARNAEIINVKIKEKSRIAAELHKAQAALVGYQRQEADLSDRSEAGMVTRVAAQKAIPLIQAQVLELMHQQDQAAISIQNTESEQMATQAKILAGKDAILDAQEAITKAAIEADGKRIETEQKASDQMQDAVDLMDDILAKQNQMNMADAGKALAKNMEKARKDAEGLQDALSKREEMGKAGSREQRGEVDKATKRMREIDRMAQDRAAVGLDAMSGKRIEALSDQQISQQRAAARLLKRLGVSNADGLSATDIEERAGRKGIGISATAREQLARNELEGRLNKARDKAAEMAQAQKDQDELEAKLNRKAQLAALNKLNGKLDTLLQAG